MAGIFQWQLDHKLGSLWGAAGQFSVKKLGLNLE